MKMRNTLSALVLAAGAAVAASAQADVFVYDTTATPPRVIDVIPSHGYGYVYGPGHYAWDGTRYVWMGDRMAANDDYSRWSWVPDDYVHMPEAFLQPDDRAKG